MTPLHARLMNPPNAVPDPGISMRNGRPVKPQPKLTCCLIGAWPECACNPPGGNPKPKRAPWRPVLWAPDMDAPIIEMSMTNIRKAVCRVWGVTLRDIKSANRAAHLAIPRQVIMALCRHLTTHGLLFVGRFCDRDHTTVLHAERKMSPHLDAVAATMPEGASARDWALAMKAMLG